ncbi:uncharacterized protein LOC130994885 [Salvia miltiorrhiza]|uniref:uncharacterized protein LOC130994885 n=1 Tax=Salvia miltiorrhiza TaxID=226208 RepID=UPI0025AB9C2B|nr:uncharacterized protein LOC130994885 [Salvia miltiorrhiza]
MAPPTPPLKQQQHQPPYEDASSPYFLPHSDNPGVQLVTQQLNGSNYSNWHRSMTTALIAKNKLAFVDGSLEHPHHTDLLFTQWMRCNSMVVSWLRNSVIPEISSSIMYIDDAYHIWNDLRERFSQGNLARICQLKQQLFNLKQGAEDVSTYFTNLRILWDEYKDFQPSRWCTCDHCRCHSARRWNDFQMQECSMQFLIGLNSTYSQIRSQIISTTPFPSLSKIFSLVLQEERQRSIEFGLPQSSLTNTEVQGSLINATGIARGRGGRGKFLCTHCGKTSHTVDKCFEIIGYPPGYGRGRGKPQGFSTDTMSRSANQLSSGDTMITQAQGVVPPFSTADMTRMISFLQSQMQAHSSSTNTQISPASIKDGKVFGDASAPASMSPPFSGSFSGDCDWEG